MQFRTEITPEKSPFRISHQTPVMFIGSCFTEHIGSFLASHLFPVSVNPFGVVYNPLSIVRNIEILINKELHGEGDLGHHNGLWYSFNHHSSFSGENKSDTLTGINAAIEESSTFLQNASYLFISLGTSWVYRYRKSGRVVCNCHKIPAAEFERFQLQPEEIGTAFLELTAKLKHFNPKLKFIFTVSPVRHWKDGAHGNQLSKASLLLGIDKMVTLLSPDAEYFPAYELLLDDLRDYRFYANDLLHPGEQGIAYIREKFTETYFDKETLALMAEIQKLKEASRHRVMNPGTESHLKFQEKMLAKISQLERAHPFLNLADIKRSFTGD
jgi:hypothetical protein